MNENEPYPFKGMLGFALRDLNIWVNSDYIKEYPRYWREFAKQLHADIFDLEFKKDQEIDALREVENAARNAEKDFMQVNDGFFKGLVPPHFLQVSLALDKLDEARRE